MKEALGCLLPFSAPRLLARSGVDRLCSGGRGLAVNDGNHHGEVALGWNSYNGPHRCMYHKGSDTEK